MSRCARGHVSPGRQNHDGCPPPTPTAEWVRWSMTEAQQHIRRTGRAAPAGTRPGDPGMEAETDPVGSTLGSLQAGQEGESESHSVMSYSLRAHRPYSPWNSPGQNTGVGNLSLLQGFDPWVRKIPWRSKWLPTPVFLPGEFHGERILACYSPWGHKELDMTECIHTHYIF